MRVLEQNLDLINLRNQLIEDKKNIKKLPSWARLMTQEEATEANNGGATLTWLRKRSKKSEPTEKNS